SNLKAINEFIKKTKGAGTADDVIGPLAAKEKGLTEAEAIAKFNLEKQTLAKKAKIGPMDAGATIRGELEAGEKAARKTAGELFDAVPEQDQMVDDLYGEFKKILKPKHPNEGEEKFPKVLKRALKNMKEGKQGSEVIPKNETPTAKAYRLARSGEYTSAQARAKADIFYKRSREISKKDPQKAMDLAQEGSNWREAAEAMEGAPQHKGWDKVAAGKPIMSLKDLQGLRSEILEDLRTAKDKGMPRSLRARLAQAVEAIDNKLTSGGEGGKELVKAQKYFKENVIDKYHVGSNKAVLMGEESVQDAMIAGKYFKEGPAGEQAATEFMNVLGDSPTAKAALKESINDNMLDAVVSPKTKEVTEAALNRWLKTHKLALKKLGLTDDYSSLTKARQQLDIALANSKKFEKSVASSVLKADVNDVVKKAFAKGSKEQSAKDLMDDLKTKSFIASGSGRSAALKGQGTGNIYSGRATHPEIINDIPENVLKNEERHDGFIKGFMNSKGEFITKEQAMKIGMKDIKAGQKAIKGLQNAMVDEVLTKAPLEGEFGELLTSGKMADNFRKYDPALKEVFKDAPEKLKAMKQVRDAVMAIERGKDFKGAGIDRAENVIIHLARRHGFSRHAVVNIAAATLQPLKRFSS
ncbi:MAG TPA: hypothetical protein VMW25_00460, partial [Clostridia bacterium]|nr:hypothetical protein [Clostridia bacterium]